LKGLPLSFPNNKKYVSFKVIEELIASLEKLLVYINGKIKLKIVKKKILENRLFLYLRLSFIK
jgi:hypothetical protein